MRIGLVGCGRWGRIHVKTVQSLPEEFQLSVVCSNNPGSVAFLKPETRIVREVEKVIESDCDAIILATPPETHIPYLRACLKAHKPVIVEKPLCLNLAEAEEIHREVSNSETPVLVNHIQLFHPGYQKLRQLLRDRQEEIRLIVSEGGAWGPFRTDTPTLWDWCPHDLSLALDLMESYPEHILALGGGPETAPGQFDLINLRIDFSKTQTVWVQAGRLFAQKQRTLSVYTPTRIYRLTSDAESSLSEATADFDDRYKTVSPAPLVYTPIPLENQLTPMQNMLQTFAKGLRGGSRARFGTSLALATVRLLSRAEEQLNSI